MASRSSRQSMVKSNKHDGQADRETRAFLAKQNRKISRRNEIEKKRGMPLTEISRNENKVQNCQGQRKAEQDTENTKRVDPIKEALKKWQKEKRLRQIQEKKTKKQPFRLGSNLSHQLSEFKHSYESNENEMNTKKMKINDQSKYAIKPLSQPVKNAAPANSARAKKTVTNLNNPTTRSSSRTMKTRSMARKIPTSKSSVTTVPKAIDKVDIPGRVTRSRVNENKTNQSISAVKQDIKINFVPPSQPSSVFTQVPTLIPENFSFTAPAGVESFAFCGDKFTFTPLSPKSAQKFFPTRTPVKEQPNQTKQTCVAKTESNDVEMMVTGDATTGEMNGDNEGENHNGMHVDATYFRNLANNEIERLKSQCTVWERESEENEEIHEEVRGKIRTVIGQVQLLVTKKFKQFSGLLDLSEDPTAEKKTLVSDLQGFWEMMYIQVEDIDKKFSELQEMKQNNWEEKKIEVKKRNVKKTAKAKKSSAKVGNSKVSESRNKFREMRAQMKAKLLAEKCNENDAFKVILTPIKNKKADADPSEPEIILTPVRRSTRKSRSCAKISVPLINLPAQVSVDLFGACKTPREVVQENEYLSNFDDSMFLPSHTSPATTQVSTADDNRIVFSPTTPAS